MYLFVRTTAATIVNFLRSWDGWRTEPSVLLWMHRVRPERPDTNRADVPDIAINLRENMARLSGAPHFGLGRATPSRQRKSAHLYVSALGGRRGGSDLLFGTSFGLLLKTKSPEDTTCPSSIDIRLEFIDLNLKIVLEKKKKRERERSGQWPPH